MSTNFSSYANLVSLFTDLGNRLRGKPTAVEVTQAQYNALTPAQKADTSKIYMITDASGGGGGHTMLPTPAADLTESQVVSAINGGLLEGGLNEDVASLFGIGKWSNAMIKTFLVQGVAGSGTPVGTTGVGTWPADMNNPTAAEKADWMCIPELYGCCSYNNMDVTPVYDTDSTSIPIAKGGWVIDDNETMSDGQGGTIPCAKVCIKFANEIPETDTHTAIVGIRVTISRTETTFVG